MQRIKVALRRVLGVLASADDRARLRKILTGSGWDVVLAHTLDGAQALLRSTPSIDVVICDTHFAGGFSWRDLLKELQRIQRQPQLIVADRLADDHLWVEVLNLGGYDLLMTPFVESEVLHVTRSAWEFRSRELQLVARAPQWPPLSRGRRETSAVKVLSAGVT